MTTEGIRSFQHLLTEREWLDESIADALWRVLYRYETQARTAFDPTTELPRTWQFLGDVADRLIAADPLTSDDPIMVKARQLAPHLIVEEWCDRHKVMGACAHAAEALTGVEAFTIYDECGMGAGRTKRDFGGRGKYPAVLVRAQELCMGLAFEVITYAAHDDLEHDR